MISVTKYPTHGLRIRGSHPVRPTPIRSRLSCTQTDKPVYKGRFGPFTIEPEDEREVFLYRLGINMAAAAIVTSSLPGILPNSELVHDYLSPSLDVIGIFGAAGLGLSLKEIHIYVDPLKKALQILWALGLCGALGIMLTQEIPAAFYVVDHPIAVWFVGPLFASLTGVAFKEGFCYGKWEGAGLFGTIPLLLLGHLSGTISEDVERGLLASLSVLITVFALRKWTQASKDDIGDKSVFEFLRLTPEEQNERLSSS